MEQTGRADAVVVGGGFFGMYLALLLKARGVHPVILERGPELMMRASYHNQARVHNGYHYPRSLMTAVRSRINFPNFLRDFPECIVDDFDKYYAVARVLGKVTADQFETFMKRVGAPMVPASGEVTRLFDPHRVEKVWKVREVAFHAGRLRETMLGRLQAAGIVCHLGADAREIREAADGMLELRVCMDSGERVVRTPWVFNCTYSGINRLRRHSGLPLIPLKHELTEMVLVEPPRLLARISVTVMCGPYFSLMPFPDRGLWTLSHVRYTPHHAWKDGEAGAWQDPYGHFDRSLRTSMGPMMIRDAARYLPAMASCRPVDSLWEVKTVLPQSELDDGRPILFHRDPQIPGLVSIMGGKLDNIYDLPLELDALGLGKEHI